MSLVGTVNRQATYTTMCSEGWLNRGAGWLAPQCSTYLAATEGHAGAKGLSSVGSYRTVLQPMCCAGQLEERQRNSHGLRQPTLAASLPTSSGQLRSQPLSFGRAGATHAQGWRQLCLCAARPAVRKIGRLPLHSVRTRPPMTVTSVQRMRTAE
jgi:hypothetical protein